MRVGDSMECVFCNIVSGKAEAYRIYEDDKVLVILDINPVSRGHCLVISKKHYTNIFDIPDEVLSHMIKVAKKVSLDLRDKLGARGINIIMTNNPEAGQKIMHAHIHIIPRYPNDGIRFSLRAKKTTKEQLQEIANVLKME